MSLKILEQVVCPPSISPKKEVDWDKVELEIGIQLPPDYKQLISVYGHGAFDNFLWVYQPVSEDAFMDLVVQSKRRIDILRDIKGEFGKKDVPYGLFPEPGGLLPWGVTDNGNICYWQTITGGPTKWTVTVNQSRGPRWAEFDGSMTEFLSAVLSGQYQCPVFPDDFPSAHPVFRSAEPN
jgi:hypothetical protein